jgi:hypothetical protein
MTGSSLSFRDLKKAERERDQMLAREKGKPDKIMEEMIRRTQKHIEALRRANIDPGRYYSERYLWFDDLLAAPGGVKLAVSNVQGSATPWIDDIQGDVFDSRGRLLSSLVMTINHNHVSAPGSEEVHASGPYDCADGGFPWPVKFWFRVNPKTVAVALIANFATRGMHAPQMGCVKLALWTVGPDGKAVLSRVYAIAGDAFPKFRDDAAVFLSDVDGDGNEDIVVWKMRFKFYDVNLKTGHGCIHEWDWDKSQTAPEAVFEVLRFSPKTGMFQKSDALARQLRTALRDWHRWYDSTIRSFGFDDTSFNPGSPFCDEVPKWK